jgi:aspartate/methionine/tyrosine aminotransferase
MVMAAVSPASVARAVSVAASRQISSSTPAAAAVAARISARGEQARGAKQQTKAGLLYYGTGAEVEARRQSTVGPPMIDLGVAESYPALHRVLEAEGCISAAASASQHAITTATAATYGDFAGSQLLRQAVARAMAENVLRGAAEPATADEIVITGGATGALEALAVALCNDGDALIVPAPLYPAFFIDFGMRAGVAIVPAEPDAATSRTGSPAITRWSLEAAAARAHAAGHKVAGVLYTSPCNPRGCVHSPAETAAVEAFAVDRGIHLIWDAVYAGTAFDENAAAAAAPSSTNCSTHTIWGLAKDFGLSGWRVGAVHSRDPRVVEALQVRPPPVPHCPLYDTARNCTQCISYGGGGACVYATAAANALLWRLPAGSDRRAGKRVARIICGLPSLPDTHCVQRETPVVGLARGQRARASLLAVSERASHPSLVRTHAVHA